MSVWRVDRVVQQGGGDHPYESGLDGFLVFDEGDGLEAGPGQGSDAADRALMQAAELLAAKSRGAATDSGDLDASAD